MRQRQDMHLLPSSQDSTTPFCIPYPLELWSILCRTWPSGNKQVSQIRKSNLLQTLQLGRLLAGLPFSQLLA